MVNELRPYTAILSVVLAMYLGLWPLSAGSGYGMSQILNSLLLSVLVFLLAAGAATRSIRSLKLNKALTVFAISSAIISAIYFISFFGGGGDLVPLVKAALWVTPILALVALWNISLNYRLLVKVWFYVGLLSNVFITFFVARFDPALGKFYAVVPGFEISSNTLSVYLVFSFVIPAVLYFERKMWVRFSLIVPLMHFSKSHVAIYLVSAIFGSCFSRRRLFLLFFAGALFLISLTLVGAYANDIRELIPPYLVKSVGKLVIACELLYKLITLGELPALSVFISQVGDGLRARIYDAALANLYIAWPLGATTSEIESVFDGYDFHNMLLFFYYQTGIVGVLSYIAIILAPLLVANKADEKFRFLLALSSTYLLARGLFISIDPVRATVLLSTLSYISCLRTVFNEKR